jgi:AraC-like DNA-binding protein
MGRLEPTSDCQVIAFASRQKAAAGDLVLVWPTAQMTTTDSEVSSSADPLLPVSRHDLDRLITSLEISFVKLAECLVAPGWRLHFAGTETSGLHYCVSGSGRLFANRRAPIELRPHTLVILPKDTSFRLESGGSQGDTGARTVRGDIANATPGLVSRFVAGDKGPPLIVICGYFLALYGPSLSLFGSLHTPIVEHFDEQDRLDLKLKEAIGELVGQEVGTGTMTAALLKLVLIPLLRRSLVSQQVWIERFALLQDPQISRAFADMLARPGMAHSVQSLAKTVGMSRSAFMARFRTAFGQPPMVALRQLRMRHAAALLSASALSIDQIARAAGYGSRSSFSRAFRRTYGLDPSEYRHRNVLQASLETRPV